MKKALLIITIVLPFFWNQPQVNPRPKTTKKETVTVWNLPKKIVQSFTELPVYKVVENWLHKVLPF